MALSTHAGGSADKAGGVHESLWGVRGLLMVLGGEASSIRIETPGDDGAEFYLQRGAIREHWQAKRQVTGQDTWSFQRLKSEGVLEFFFSKFRAGEHCVFASVSDAPELRVLSENAAAAASLDEFKTHFLEKKRSTQFNDLQSHVGAISEDETFAFLRTITVHGGREITLDSVLSYAVGAMFEGSQQAIMAILRDYYVKSSHETLIASDIEKHLLSCGIKRRHVGLPDSRDRILDLTRGYIAGQKAKLIQGKLIRRAVADGLVAKITSSLTSLDILITSAAGGGKSAGLYQIVDGLQAAGIPTLAFRLDRVEPAASAIMLGEKLGLGESPAVVLAESFPNQPVVLVVDQLDFVSTTSGRHPDFFDTIAALRDEVLGLRFKHRIHLIMACRKFDFEHDHRLKQLTTKDQPLTVLGELDSNEVKTVVEGEGGDFAKLTSQQQEMLRLPQNLSLFVDARLARTENQFTTAKELCDAYWKEKRNAISTRRSEFGQYWMPVISRVASSMSERQELSVSAQVLDEFPPAFLESMVSEGVLTWDDKRYGFGHETFFDYCYARTLPNGGRTFVNFLEGDTQHLFRRAQLRQVLAFLRDDNFTEYLASLTRLLNSAHIRPHLKLLAVELVAAHPQARDEELNLLLPWIESEITSRRESSTNPDKLASRIWDRFFTSNTLFSVADRTGLIEKWLHSSETWLLDLMAGYLRWQTAQNANRVAELLEPFAGKEDWRIRLRHVMEGRNLENGRKFFDLFLRLLADGTLDDAKDRFASNGSFWLMIYGLAEKRPDWCAELAACWLDRRIALASTTPGGLNNVYSLFSDGFGAKHIIESAEGSPQIFLDYVLPSVIQAAVKLSYNAASEELPRDWVWPVRIQSEHIGLAESFVVACETALKIVGQNSPDLLHLYISQLAVHRLYTANALLLTAYLSSPKTYADDAIGQILEEPRRLRCGFSDSPYWTAQQVIQKCSPHCNDELYQKLEAILLDFVPSYEQGKAGYKRRGYAAFTLTSALADNRLSNRAKGELQEWKVKFAKPAGPPIGIRVGFVGSPIKEESATHMTNEHWLGAIAKYNTEDRQRTFEDYDRGGALELARLLQKFTGEQPNRFAELALQFPDDTHPYYFSHVLRGLKESVLPFAMKLDVARRVFGLDHHDCYQAALDVLGTVPDNALPDDAIQYIKNAAGHPDPEGVWDDESPYYGGDILTTGMNSVRGYVAGAIHDLVCTDVCYISIFSDTIEKLVSDTNVAVRSCIAASLFAAFRHDSVLALHWCDLLMDSDDQLLATAHVEHLIHSGLREHTEHFAPTIQRMLNSKHDKVRQAGGTLACLARLYHAKADYLAENALAGDEHCRLGACEVAKSNLLSPGCRSWCEQALSRLFADDSKEVRKKAAGCFWHLWQSPDTPLTDFGPLIQTFVDSPAFPDEPTYLLHALEETKHKVPDTVLDVCEVFMARCAEEARDIRTSLAADEHTIGKLVFTAYAQLQSQSLQIRSLDVIDKMNLEGLSSANQHLSEFER